MAEHLDNVWNLISGLETATPLAVTVLKHLWVGATYRQVNGKANDKSWFHSLITSFFITAYFGNIVADLLTGSGAPANLASDQTFLVHFGCWAVVNFFPGDHIFNLIDDNAWVFGVLAAAHNAEQTASAMGRAAAAASQTEGNLLWPLFIGLVVVTAQSFVQTVRKGHSLVEKATWQATLAWLSTAAIVVASAHNFHRANIWVTLLLANVIANVCPCEQWLCSAKGGKTPKRKSTRSKSPRGRK